VKASRTEIERALDNPPAHIRLFLLYGPDEGESLALAQRLERAMGSAAERIDLDGAMLKSDPARLSDEAAALSLFGDRRHIRVAASGDEAMAAVEGLLEAPMAGNPVAIVAGALKPGSALLKCALADARVMACISYPLDAERAGPLAAALAREQGVRLEGDVAQTLAAAAANDRGLIAREVEKLATFLDAAPDRPKSGERASLEAIGAGEGEADLSRLVDAVLGGHPEKAAAEIARLGEQGVSGIPAIRAIAKRVQLLARLAASAMADGKSPRAVVEAQGKAIFWKEKGSVERQLARWSPERLARLSDRLLTAERGIKGFASAGDILADAEFITIARAAKRAR
jgi:DNA polymerase III subunit delta